MQKLKCNLFGSERCSPTLGFLLTLACFFSHSFASAQTDTTTIAGLRSMTSASTTRNYFITDPGKQGLWRYDQADNSSRDNTGTIAVSSSGLRFKRIYTGPVHVTWFGCIGNGSFDNTDTLEFIFANFTQIHIPAGTYVISIGRLDNRNQVDNIDRGLNLRSGTTLTGEGNTVTIIKQTGVINDVYSTYYGALRVAWVSNVTIRDIGIYGENRPMVPTNTLSEAKGLVVYGTASNVLVERCRFQWIFGHGVADFASIGTGGNSYKFCVSSYNGKNAFNLNIPNLTFTDNYGEGNNFSLLEASTGPSLIANNVAKNNLICGIAVGGFVDSANGPPNQGKFNVVRDNICTGNGFEGLRITIGTSNSEIYGNICFKNGMAGINVSEQIEYYPGVYTRNNNIYNNICFSNGKTGSPAPIGIQVSAPFNNIYNNLVTDSSVSGYGQAFGILVSPRVSNFNRLYGNRVIGNRLSDYYFQTYSNFFFQNPQTASNVTLNGSGGFSGNTFTWSQTAGPNTATLSTPNLFSTRVSNLINGVYRFRLNSPTRADSLTLQMIAAGPFAPIAQAGINRYLTLPLNSQVLEGGLSYDVDGTIAAYNWSQVSGPTSASFSSPSSVSTSVLNLNEGIYRFRLQVTDNAGLVGSDTISVYVYAPSILPNKAPVAFAGLDRAIVLPVNSVTLNGTGSSDSDGSISSYVWSQIAGPNTSTLGTPTSTATNATNLVEGVYQFRLEVTDNLGLKAYDTVVITVKPVSTGPNQAPIANAGLDRTVTPPSQSTLLDGSRSTDSDGAIVSQWWSQISGPNTAGLTSPSVAITDAFGLATGTYRFKLQVTDNLGLSSFDTVIVYVGVTPPAPTVNRSPIAVAGPDQTITLPVSSVVLNGSSSSDPDGSISAYLWSQVSGPSTSTMGSVNTASANVSNLIQGVYQFRLQVTDNAGATAADTISVTVNPAVPTPTPTSAPNQLPVAVAGNDIVITLPTNNATLNGAASNDPDGTISAYSWSQLSGPGTALIISPGGATTNINSLVQGVYLFRLVVTDNSGATGADTVSVTVNAAPPPPPAPNRLPVAIAGADQSVRFPINFVALNGNASFDPDGAITSYSWSQISGPGNASIAAPFSASTVVNGLVAGVYSFRLEVKDNSGAIAADTVMVRVQLFQPPIPVAPDTLMVKMPVESVELDGSKSYDPDGSIAAFSWTFVQGPNTPLINAQANPVAKVRNLVEGAYVFTLTLTNDKGLSASKNVKVIVSNSNNRLAIKTLSVYPNPVSGTNATLQLEGDYNDKIYMDIYDLNGRVVSRQEFIKNVPSFRQIIYVSHLTNGLYVVQLRTLMRVLGTVKFQKY